jgi:hypothetical protein
MPSTSLIQKATLIVVCALIAWNIHKGLSVQEIGIPGFTIKFGPSQTNPKSKQTPDLRLSGSWRYEMQSAESGQRRHGALDLTADGDLVSGAMENPDPERVGERSAVEGTYVNGLLKLIRHTNQAGVVQEYRLSRDGNRFRGTFVNIGQVSGKFKDSGTIDIQR